MNVVPYQTEGLLWSFIVFAKEDERPALVDFCNHHAPGAWKTTHTSVSMWALEILTFEHKEAAALFYTMYVDESDEINEHVRRIREQTRLMKERTMRMQARGIIV